MFKEELENRDLRKSLYFYVHIVDAVKKEKKGCVRSLALYSGRWKKWDASACRRPNQGTGKRPPPIFCTVSTVCYLLI